MIARRPVIVLSFGLTGNATQQCRSSTQAKPSELRAQAKRLIRRAWRIVNLGGHERVRLLHCSNDRSHVAG
jgi:hypothetical protein